MKISVITVSYNSADTIQETFDSVREQTHDDIEYIVVDGDSDDGTVEIIKENEDIIDHWISEPDAGIYDAMNKAIQFANGEWINFMHSGDYFYNKNTLEEISFNEFYDSDVLYGNYIAYDSRINLKRKFEPVIQDINDFYELPPCQQAMFYRRGLLENEKHNLNYNVAADDELYLRLMNSGYNFSKINDIVCIYETADNYSFDNALEGLFERLNLRRKYLGIREYYSHLLKFPYIFLKTFLIQKADSLSLYSKYKLIKYKFLWSNNTLE